MKKIDKLTLILIAVALVCTCIIYFGASSTEIGLSESEYATSYFNQEKVNTVNITIDNESWQDMLANPLAEEYHVCSISINGDAYNGVAIRTKGMTSLSQVASSDSDRYSFKIKSDEYVKDQSFKGLSKFVLNNNIQDTTYMKDYLSYQLMTELGVPTPLFAYAAVYINGEYYGLYLMVEAIEEEFAERNFGTDFGNLYKPESMNGGGGGGGNMPSGFDMNQMPKGFNRSQMQGGFNMNQMTGGFNRSQMTGGFDMNQMPGGFDMNQTAGGFDMNQTAGGFDMSQMAGGFDMNQTAGGFDMSQMPGGFDMNQMAGGFNMNQTAGGFDMSQMPGGFDMNQMAGGFDMNQMAGGFGDNAGNRSKGGMPGGFGGSGGGSDLVYTDDSISSYPNIFDNAVFSRTDTATSKVRVITALKHLKEGTELDKYIDTDEVLRYFAGNTAVVNLDNYVGTMKHNYYLYEKDGKLSMIPWDYNLAFGGMGSSASDAVNFPIDTPVSSGLNLSERPMVGSLLADENMKEKYHSYIKWIAEEFFGSSFATRVDKIDSMINEYVKTDPTAFYSYEEYQKSLPELKKFATLRAESMIGQLNGTIPSTYDGQKATGAKLISTTNLTLSALGGMGGGGGGGMGNMNQQGRTTGQQNKTENRGGMNFP